MKPKKEHKKKVPPRYHTGIRCGFCRDVIFSWSVHDFKRCWCGKVFIDGGFDYMRYGGEGLEDARTSFVAIQIIKMEQSKKGDPVNENSKHKQK